VPANGKLVLKPATVCDRQAQQPKISVRHPLEPGTIAACMDPSQDVHVVGRAPPSEGCRPRLNQREFMVCQKFVDSRMCGMAVRQQLRNLRMPLYWQWLVGAVQLRLAQLNVHVPQQAAR
jgi:hypothetical protein